MKRRKQVLITLLFIIGTFISFNHFSCTNSISNDQLVFGNQDESPLKRDGEISKAWDIQQSFRKIYELYKDRVVYISTEQSVQLPRHPFYELFNVPRERKETGLGSGFVVSKDGFICTNFHVIAPNNYIVEKITVIAEGEAYQAKVQGFDQAKDIALLKIEPKKQLKPVFIGDSESVQVGDWAIAIGNPFGLAKSFTVGVISAIGRNIDEKDGEPYIQTDVAINPGNSGGPLINIKGEVVGINRMIFSKSGGYMGIGFAIPANRVKEILENLKKQKYVQKGYIGVALIPMTRYIARQLRWRFDDFGAVVESVIPEGPADRAGIIPGDIIYAINDKKINSINELIQIIEKTGAGKKIKLYVWRRGQRIRFTLIIAAKPIK